VDTVFSLPHQSTLRGKGAAPASAGYGPAAALFNGVRRFGKASGGGLRRFATAFAVAAVALFLTAPGPAAAKDRTILALGDSLTAGYGLAVQDGFPSRLEAALRVRGVAARVVNAGVSGDTSAGGLGRLDWLMAEKPDLVIVELGANDGLRGLDTAETRRNLDAILTRTKNGGTPVLLTGMQAPPNLGREYADAFNEIFPQLAKQHKVPLYPFFLEGVAARPDLNLSDGLHPNEKGVKVIVDRILPYVLQALGEQ
jgi:acyl-CoA thioesterase-1